MNKVAVVSLDKKRNIRARHKTEAEIRLAALKILKKLKKDGVYVEIFLADNAKMRFLNRKFRRRNLRESAPNVLSFKEPKNFPHPEFQKKKGKRGKGKVKVIGEIYLNMKISNLKFQISNLLAHGLLHLFGYSHKRKIDRMKMERIERLLIGKLNHSIF